MSDIATPAGWVIQVATDGPRAEIPVFGYFDVAIAVVEKAIEATKKRSNAAPEARVGAVRPLSSSEIEHLGMKTGDVRAA